MLEAALDTMTADTCVAVGLDADDPALAAYGPVVAARERVWCLDGPRRSLSAWTNAIATLGLADEFRALASFGDDHVPRTPGWDSELLAAIGDMGGTGMSYPDDKRRTDIPEAVVISADIVRALGWMCEPSLRHFYVDNVWADLGSGAGCIRFCPEVIVEHMHYLSRPGVIRDVTYAEAEERMSDDQIAYQRWRAERMAADIAKIRTLRDAAAL